MMEELGRKLVDSAFLGAIGYGYSAVCQSSIISLQGSKISYIYKAPPILETLRDVNSSFVGTTCILFSLIDGVARSIIDETFPDHSDKSTFILSRVTASVLTAAGISYLLGALPSLTIGGGYTSASIVTLAFMKSVTVAMQ